jgi:hypothetical protein
VALYKLEIVVHPLLLSSFKFGRQYAYALVCAGAVLAAGCHNNNNAESNYGIAWTTVANGAGTYGNNVQFASYVVTVDSIVLTDAVGNQYTAMSTLEPVDFVKLSNIAELWGSASIPADTYVAATITLDYTTAAVALFVNGVPTPATVVVPGETTLTTVFVTVAFDPSNPLVISNSYATTNAQRLALDFDLAASNVVDLSTSPATVTAAPFFRLSNAAADTRLIRIRGPLINSNATTGTYSIYERPFYDEANNIGSITLFTDPATIFDIDGTVYTGAASALAAISQLSAGVTATEAYATFEVTPSTINASGQPTGTAGIFTSVYSVIGGTLETNYTENLEGDVIARNGNILTMANSTVAGATVQLSQIYFEYVPTSSTNPTAQTQVLIGPGTIVSAEGTTGLPNLDYNSIAVGQHITAVGTFEVSSTGIFTIDAVSPTTGSTAGQVRLQSTQLFGQLQSSATGSLTLDLQTIDNLPASLFDFAGDGTGAAETPVASAYLVDTSNAGTVNLTGAAAGTSLWVDGFTSGFGKAPPDFLSFPNLTFAPSPNQAVSGVNEEAVVPASLQVVWNGTGTTTPFASSSGTSFSIDGTSTALASAVIQIGPEIVALSTLATAVTVVPNTVPNCVATSKTNPQPCVPLFAFSTVTTAATSTTPAVTAIVEYNGFATFMAKLGAAITTAQPVTQLAVNGYYDRTTNTFTANNVDVVL